MITLDLVSSVTKSMREREKQRQRQREGERRNGIRTVVWEVQGSPARTLVSSPVRWGLGRGGFGVLLFPSFAKKGGTRARGWGQREEERHLMSAPGSGSSDPNGHVHGYP